MSKKKIICFGVGVVVLSLLAFSVTYDTFTDDKKSSKISKSVEEVVNVLDKTPPVIPKPNDEIIETEIQLIRYIHRMTHPVVKSNTKWYSSVEPSQENIQKALDKIDDSNYFMEDNIKKVVKILNEFNEGNFDNAHELHNLMWDIEDGTIGKASGLDKEGIKEIKKKYYK